MKKVGIIGWRGMVGSVLMERMVKENDFKRFTPFFFTTSQKGQKSPDVGMVNDYRIFTGDLIRSHGSKRIV